tara:strand:- start:52 stop:363 length:312 start_codon:yes stop_codon:yes gene_type:complete
MKKEKTIQNYIEEATKNIVDDRAATKTLLMSLMDHMKTGEDRHREFGIIAAKYLETLQRSNEQLVKLASLVQKKEQKNEQITDKEKDDLFDIIKNLEVEDEQE